MIKKILKGCISKEHNCDLQTISLNTDNHTYGLMILPLLYSIYKSDYDYVSTLNLTAKKRIRKQIKKLGHQVILCGHKHDTEQLYTLGSRFINFDEKKDSPTARIIEIESNTEHQLTA